MGYSAIASELRSQCSELESVVSELKSISFDSVWSGAAHDTVSQAITTLLSKTNTEIANIQQYAGALDSLQKYKDTKIKIDSLKAQYNGIPNTKENANARLNLSSTINYLQVSNSQLRTNIINRLSGFSSVSSEIEVVTYDPAIIEDYGQFIFDVDSLVALYANKWGADDGITADPLTILSNGKSLYDYYNQYDENGNVIEGSGKKYVEGIILDIQSKYSGRDAAVNCALAMLQLAADKDIKLDYEHKGTNPYQPYVPTEQVASGVDCNPFVSWCLDKGIEGGFQWRPVQNFTSIGTTIPKDNWSNAKPGDVLANGGHVIIIVDNDPAKGTFTIAHASGSTRGILIEEKSYNSFSDYTVRDMTEIYNGNVDTDRAIFNQYVNWDTYQRKV